MENKQLEKLIDSIKKHEGYRDYIYLDSLNNPTCGWGHHLYHKSRVPLAANEAFLKQDIADAISDFLRLPKKYYEKLNPVRRRIIVEMIFNMGIQRVLGFKKMWKATMIENWEEAKIQLLDSRWARQVGNRAIEMADVYERGED